MFNRIIIYSKNLIRYLIYKTYRLYKNKIQSGIPLYDLQTFDVIKTLPKNAYCIDVGVNEGQILNFINNHCTEGTILGIEPIPYLAKYLSAKYPKVTIKQIAVSNQNGECEFFYFPKRKGVSGLKARKGYIPNDLIPVKLKVNTFLLDEIYNHARLDFIKIDVEGCEYNVIQGASKLIEKFHPIIIFESGLGGLEYFEHSPEELFDLLNMKQYNISTMDNYLNNKCPFTKHDFLNNYLNGYDFQYIAYTSS